MSIYGAVSTGQTKKNVPLRVEGRLLFSGASERTLSQVLQLQPIFSPLAVAKVKERLALFQTLVVFFHHCHTACSVQHFIDWKASRGWERKAFKVLKWELLYLGECQGHCRVVGSDLQTGWGVGLSKARELLKKNS